MEESPRPPRWFERLLETTLPEGIVREDVVGSMAEEYADLARRRGRRFAGRWYRKHTLGIAVRAFAERLSGRRHGDFRGSLNRDGDAFRETGRGRVAEMSTILMDLRFTLRSLMRAPAATVVVLVTLALGVGANTAMFSVVNGVLLTSLPYADPDRLVQVWPEKRHSMPMIQEIRESTSSFEVMSGITGGQYTLLGGREPEIVDASVVGVDFFDVIGIPPRIGRAFVAEDAMGTHGPVVILSHDFWTRRFGADPAIVEQTIDLSGEGVERRTVIGVLPPDFPALNGGAQVWTPLVTNTDLPEYYGSYGLSLVARLRPDVRPEAASQEVARLAEPFTERHPTQFREARRSPVAVVPVHEVRVRNVRSNLLLLLGAVGFVLLIACTNVANILLARANARSAEIGVRVALGAGSGRVTRLVLTESLFLGVVGGSIGAAAAALSLPALVARIEGRLPNTELIELDLSVLLFALGVSVLAGLLFGAAPAVRAGRQDPALAMGTATGRSGVSRRRMRLNDTLVTAEVALSLVLVLSAGLLLKSLWRLSSVDPGFEADRILSMRLMLPARYDGGEERRILFDEVLERMEALPSVDRAAAVNWLPLFGGSSGIPYRVAGQGLEEGTPSIVGSFKVVSPGFFEIMDMPAIEGRLVEEGAAAGEGEGVWDLVINEAMRRRHWPSESPIGAQIVSASDGDPLARVVGVVKDIRQEELNETSAPEFYLLGSQAGYAYRYVLIRTADDPSSLAESATAIVHEVAPDVPIRNVQTMREVVDGELTSSRFYLWLFGGFAVLALALGMVGVYGVMAYTVSQRAREVGVRLVLGAHRSKVVVSTMRSAMGPVVLGIAVGLPLAALASRLLTSFLFEVEPTDPWVFGVVAALLAVSGLVASAVPAWRASRLDPAGALREV